jgi:DNA-binding transcriptional ArsR family regulator
LKRAGLVEDRKKGLWVYYRLAQFKNEPLSKLLASTSQCLNRIAIIEQDRKRLERAHSSNSAVAPAPTTVDVRLL